MACTRTASSRRLATLGLAGLLAVVPAGVARAVTDPADKPQITASFDDVVRTVVQVADTVYVGGDFTHATDARGTRVRPHVAAVDATTGRLRAWNPRADGAVLSIAVAGGAVFLGGRFGQVGGLPRRRLAQVSASTGAVAGGFVHRPSGPVRALTVHRQVLYAGGSFAAVDGVPRGRLASFTVADGRLTQWAPQASGTVRDLAGSAGRVLVAGQFGGIDQRPGTGFLAAVDATTGAVLPGFDADIGYTVTDLAVSPRAVFAAADGPGGHLRALGPDGADRWDLVTDGGVQAVDVLGGRVYFGGHFDLVCPTADRGGSTCRSPDLSRRKLAAVTRAGEVVAWAPQANSPLGVVALEASPRTSTVAVGGAFTHLQARRVVQPHFALFR